MEIHEFKAEKAEMENKIQTEVGKIVSDFYKKTGFSPSSIYIDLIEVTITDGPRHRVVGEVHTDIEI